MLSKFILLNLSAFAVPRTPKDAGTLFCKFIGYTIMLFGCLLYDELIMLNIWGFDKKTKEKGKKRSEEEKQTIESNIPL